MSATFTSRDDMHLFPVVAFCYQDKLDNHLSSGVCNDNTRKH